MEKVNLALLLVTILFSSASATNPGFVLRVNEKGLEYAKDNIMTMFVEKLKNINPKELSGKICLRLFVYLKYKATGIKNTEFSVSSASLETVRGRGISLSASGVDFSYTGDWSFFFRYNWRTFRDRGTFKMSGKKARFSFMIEVGERDGRPTISDLSCKGKIECLDVKLFKKSRPRIVYNEILRKFGFIIKPKVLSMFCDGVTKTLKEDLEKELSLIPIRKQLDKYALIDYSLIQTPLFTEDYMNVSMKAEIMSAIHPTESGLKPNEIPGNQPCNNMICFFITDYVLNTAGEVYFKENFFNRTINASQVPSTSKYQLNTNLLKLIGLSEIYDEYPNRPLFLHLYCTKAPKMTTQSTGISIAIHGNIEVFVVTKYDNLDFLFTLAANLTGAGTVNVNLTRLQGSVSKFNVEFDVVKSSFGEIKPDIGLVNILLHFLADQTIVKELNERGRKGMPLPVLDNMQLKSSCIHFGKNFFSFDTDLKYLGPTKRLPNKIPISM